jgi:peptide/nickel transport system substrate-binding protein
LYKKIIFSSLIVVILLTMCIAGSCSSSQSTSSPSSQPPPNSTTPVQQAKPTPGGTLRVVQNSDIGSFLPWEAVGASDFAQRVPAIENLVRADENGNVIPFLSESFTQDAATKTITFKLRKGVTFQDGTAFDATACKWNFEQLLNSPLYGSDFTKVSSMDVVDDNTLRINFSSWDQLFITNMVVDAAMISPTAYEKNGIDWARLNPCGTGPFKMTVFTRDVQKVFEKNTDYWQKGKPYLDEVIFKIIADPTVQIAAFLKGENDVITNVNPADVVTLKDKPGVTVSQSKVIGYYGGLFANMVSPDSPFKDVRVRQAISYAINRQDICDYVYKGYATPTYQTGTTANWYYNPNVVGYPYNPDKARALLTEAGYPDGFSTVIHFQSLQLYRDVYTAVQSDLANIGIMADLQPAEGGAYWGMLGGPGWEDGMLGATMATYPALLDAVWNYYSKSMQGGIPKEILHTDELDSLIEQMSTAPNREAEKALAWKIQAMVTDQLCLFIAIDVANPLAVKNSKLHDDYISFISGSPWTYADAWMEQ